MEWVARAGGTGPKNASATRRSGLRRERCPEYIPGKSWATEDSKPFGHDYTFAIDEGANRYNTLQHSQRFEHFKTNFRMYYTPLGIIRYACCFTIVRKCFAALLQANVSPKLDSWTPRSPWPPSTLFRFLESNNARKNSTKRIDCS